MEITDLATEHKALLDALKKAIVDIDEEKAESIAEQIIREDIDPNIAIKYAKYSKRSRFSR